MNRIIIFLLIFFLYHLYGLLFGYLVFYLGKKFCVLFLKKVGHFFVSFNSAPFFGINKKWISKNCPDKHCEKCPLWTCKDFVSFKCKNRS